jgi:hypothetical protein
VEKVPKKRSRPAKEKHSAEETVDTTSQIPKKHGRPSKAKPVFDEGYEEPIVTRKRGRTFGAAEGADDAEEGDINLTKKHKRQSQTKVVPEDANIDDLPLKDLPTPEPTLVESPPPEIIQADAIPMPSQEITVTEQGRTSHVPYIPQASGLEEQVDIQHPRPEHSSRPRPVLGAQALVTLPHNNPVTGVYHSFNRGFIPIDPVLLADVLEHTQRILHSPVIMVS